MADQWFYSSGGDRVGPLTSRQLRDLADAGTILPGDTVWKGGIERGVAAHRVKGLFAESAPVHPRLQPQAAVAPVEVVPAAVPQADAAERAPERVRPDPVERPRVQQQAEERKGRATAGPGVIIVSQDGSYVQFRKKCTVCAHEDTNRNRLKIANGVTRVNFFCPRCRKLRGGEVRGQRI